MSVTLIDGFDTYNGSQTGLGLGSKWAYAKFNNNTCSTDLVPGRFSGQALRLAEPVGGPAAAGWLRAFGSPTSTVSYGFAYRSSNLAGHSQTFVPMISALYDSVGGIWHILIAVSVDGRISAYRATGPNSGTMLGASVVGTIKPNTFHYVEVEMVCHDTSGRVRIVVDGVEVLNVTGADTRNGGTGTADTIVLAANSGDFVTANHDFDDLYVTDSALSLGEKRVETLVPNADVTKTFVPNAGTTNYTQVDDLPNTGDTDFVQGSNLGDVDTYAFTDLSANPQTIEAVQLIAYAKKTDASTRGIALQVKSGTAVSDGPLTNLNATYAKIERLLTYDPNTGSAWTTAAVNALRGGPKVAL